MSQAIRFFFFLLPAHWFGWSCSGWFIYGSYGPLDLGLDPADDVDALAGGDFFGILA